MRRTMALVVCVGLLLAVAWPGRGAAPPRTRLSDGERVRLTREADDLNERLIRLYQQGKAAEAVPVAMKALQICQGLYPEKDFPDGHPGLASSLNNLGFVLIAAGEHAKALGYYEQALAMRQKLHPKGRDPDGHPELGRSLHNLGFLLEALGQLDRATDCYEQALAMRQRLYPKSRYPDGHPELATSLNSLGEVFRGLKEFPKALGYYEQALAMQQKLYPQSRYPDGHVNLALSLNNLGVGLSAVGESAKALDVHERALAMFEKLYPESRFKNGHPNLATSLTRLGGVLKDVGEPAKALPYHERALAMRQKLYPPSRYPDGHPEVARSLSDVGFVFDALGASAKALGFHKQGLAMRQRLYPPRRYPDGHPELATGLNNLGHALVEMGEYARALDYYEQALAMRQKLHPPSRSKDGHPILALSLNNLGFVLKAQGESARALEYYEKALAMYQKLYPESRYPDGHPNLALSLNNLGGVLSALGELARAQGYYEKALAMRQKLYPKSRYQDGHSELATSLSNVGNVLNARGESAKALEYYENALAMRQKLYPPDTFKDGHPQLALALNNLGGVWKAMGEPAKALGYFEQALAMQQKLYPESHYKDGHPSLALGFSNLGFVLHYLGEFPGSLEAHTKALRMYHRQAERELAAVPEARALAYLNAQPRTRAGYLSTSLALPATEASSYDMIWPDRVALFRLMLRRHEAARVAALDSPLARQTWQDLGEVRRQVSRLLVVPSQDLAARDKALAKLERDQDRLERDLAKLLPQLDEHKRLARSGPSDLAAKLPKHSAFLDFVRYVHYTAKGKFDGWRYLTYVLTPDGRVVRLDLGDAKPIDDAIASWRRSIEAGRPSSAPALLRTLTWEKVEQALPKGTQTLYLCVEGELTKLPFAALPGRGKDSVLLEDYALAVVPAGAWLLQQLEKPAVAARAGNVVAVGAIDFGKGPYQPLPGTARELDRVVEALGGKDKAVVHRGRAATVTALRKGLPEAQVAHLATHAYFDQKALDAEYERTHKQREAWTPGVQGSERVGLAARNPLGFVGLVLAGGNDPSNADGGGILTGLDVLELSLNKMRLCVLSACETGRGKWEEATGVSGLSLALHVAGCRNVVGSLWQVDDAATAALMTQFYHELRVNKRTPLQALREAQLTIYRHPERIPDLAGERGRPAALQSAKLGSQVVKPVAGAKGRAAPTRLWAAFVLSGPGD